MGENGKNFSPADLIARFTKINQYKILAKLYWKAVKING